MDNFIRFPIELIEGYILDTKLNNLLKGKRVAYVGPSPHLEGKNLGKFIDNHDLVIRAGDPPVGFLGRTEGEKDYGSRTDILVHSFNWTDQADLGQDPKFMGSLQYAINSMIKGVDQASISVLESMKMPFHYIEDDVFENFRKKLGCYPNQGYSGLLMLLHYDIEKLFLTGFSFYNMGRADDDGEKYYYKEWYSG